MARNSLKNVMRLIETAKDELPIEQDFLNDLKRSIELSDSKNKRKGSQSYKPSSMNCIRQMYYMVTGKDTDATGSSYVGIGICNSGTDIHERIQKAVLEMRENGMDCEYVNVADYVRSRGLDYLEIVKEPNFEIGEYETKLYHRILNISFLCDGIIKYKGKYYILELKSESSNKFWNREGVDPSHYNQGTSYSLDMKSFMFKPTNEMKQDIVGRIEICDSYVKKLIAPPKPEDVSRKTCEYCSYKTQCRKDG